MDETKPQQAQAKTPQAGKKKSRAGTTLLKVLIWLLVIAAGVFVVLFLASKIAQFASIGDMLNWIWQQF